MAYTPTTQYTEGDVDATISGEALLWEDGGDTLATVSAGKPLPVSVISGVTSGTQYTEGDTDASITGTALLWEDGANTLASVSAAKPLPVGDGGGSITVDGPLTDAQLRASAVPVSGTVTITDGSGPVTVDGTVAATQSGTWTVQPGNTANTTAWKVDASSVAVPVTDNGGSLSIDDGGSSITVDGGLTHNSAAPAAATNVGVLPAVANAAAPTYSEGDQVLLSVDLGGSLRSLAATDITTRNGLDCQAVYDPVVREACEQILLTLLRLEERLFSEE